MPKIDDRTSAVTSTPPASSDQAVTHFASLLAYESDCWDVHDGLNAGRPDFVLLDVRSPELFAAGHIEGAVNLPHGRIVERNVAAYPPDTIFVTYCNGPHCNGADKGALRLAKLGRPVKKMIGGVTGWIDEGFTLTPPESTPLENSGPEGTPPESTPSDETSEQR
ncbi:MAG: rhodanese-like domain-containing protein [Acidimicrobiales bacterium]